ncbi:MAG: D-TA family PLP-dependent enzyme [Geminicoccaceae bacterium]|nr:MAG: D-TA family PLP-dependent enzyme [Geminicoccaceae bacterium]
MAAGPSFPTVDTPAVLVDLDRAEANIDRFQRYCDEHGLKARPHIKTHKLPSLAKRQLQMGAVGITCQKISEALAMVEGGGIDDVLLTYNVLGAAKLKELQRLAARVRLTVVADSEPVVDGLASAFTDPAKPLPVLVECDTGAGRCGVTTPEAAAALAQHIDRQPGLTFQGLMTYPPKGDAAAAADWLARAKAACEAVGLTVTTITSGGSPDIWQAHRWKDIVTEYRPGTYVYFDRSLVDRGVCTWDDCALTVLTTVVSVPTEHRAIIDAGSKVLTSDLLGLDGHGHVLGRPDIVIDQLSEEHGRLVSQGPIGLRVGDRVRIVPNHACVVSNMLDHVVTVRGDRIDGPLPVAARGLVW